MLQIIRETPGHTLKPRNTFLILDVLSMWGSEEQKKALRPSYLGLVYDKARGQLFIAPPTVDCIRFESSSLGLGNNRCP